MKRATCRKDHSEWAVKCIEKGKLRKEDEDALKVEVEILEKVRGEGGHKGVGVGGGTVRDVCESAHTRVRAPHFLLQVDHPNIVRLHQIFDCKTTFYMVMEVMAGGELFDRIVEKSKYSEREASEVVRKVADALRYCHERGIVHRCVRG